MKGAGTAPSPPRWAVRWLDRRLAADERDEVLGDLAEQFQTRVDRSGAARASRWYVRQSLALSWGFFIHRRDPISMTHERTRGVFLLGTLGADWRQAWRSLRHARGFSLVALLTLTLGIGLSTAVFSLVNGVLLKPLPIADADRLVRLGETGTSGVPPIIRELRLMDGGLEDTGTPKLADTTIGMWSSHSTAIAAFGPYSTDDSNVQTSDGTLRVTVAGVGPHFFDVVSGRPLAGRLLGPDDDVSEAGLVALVGERFWNEHLGRRADAIGSSLMIEDKAYTIVGILPASYLFPEPGVDVWKAGQWKWPAPGRARQFMLTLDVIARLAPSATVEDARVEGRRVLESIAAQTPAGPSAGSAPPDAIVRTLLDAVVSPVRPALIVLSIGIAGVLLAACVNLASLLLARHTARVRDIAVRLALGASRWRVIRPLLFEQLLLGGAGALLGGLLARLLVTLLPRLAPADLPRLADVRFDVASLSFAAGIGLCTAIVVGLLPVWQIPRSRLRDFMSAAHLPWFSGARSTDRARSLLVVCQVALAAALLVGAALIGRTLVALLHVDPGYRPEGVLTFQVGLPSEVWHTQPGRERQFYTDLVQRLQAMPGVVAAGHTTSLPLHSGGHAGTLFITGRPRPSPDAMPRAHIEYVSTDYYKALGTRLLRGRFFSDQDTLTSEMVLLINDTFAARYFPGEEPVGQQLHTVGNKDWRIVGVIESMHLGDMRHVAPPSVILPASQVAEILGLTGPSVGIAVRTTGDPLALARDVRQLVHALDPTSPIYGATPLETLLGATFAQPRFYAIALALFAALALSTALLGIYGALAYAVERRRRELGVRRALGASERHIVRLVAARAASLGGVGLGIGLGAGALGARFMSSVLFGVRAFDPWSYAAVIAIVGVIVGVASWQPVRRALRIEPARALHVE